MVHHVAFPFSTTTTTTTTTISIATDATRVDRATEVETGVNATRSITGRLVCQYCGRDNFRRGAGLAQHQKSCSKRPHADVNSLFCPAHGCTNSRFIIAELQIPRTQEHVFLGSVSWPRTECRPVRNKGVLDLTSRDGRWCGSCHGHKRRTSQSPLSCLLPLVSCLFSCLLSLLLHSLSRFTPSFSLFSCSFCCLSLDFRVSVVAGLRFW